MVTISPADYLIEGNDKCQIALETSSDDSRHVRLGTYFLKNSFVQLDFDNNIIVMGPKEAVKDINTVEEDEVKPNTSDDDKDKPSEPTKPEDESTNKPTG